MPGTILSAFMNYLTSEEPWKADTTYYCQMQILKHTASYSNLAIAVLRELVSQGCCDKIEPEWLKTTEIYVFSHNCGG